MMMLGCFGGTTIYGNTQIGGKHRPFFWGDGPGVLVLAWDCGFLLLLLSYYSFLNFQIFFCWNCTKKALGDEKGGLFGSCHLLMKFPLVAVLKPPSNEALYQCVMEQISPCGTPHRRAKRRRELPWSRPYCTRRKWLDFTLLPLYHASQVYFLFILFPIEFYSIISRSWSSFYLCKTVNLDVHFLYWSGQRSLVAAHWLSSTFDRESFLAWWGLIFTFFLVPKFGVLLSPTPPSIVKYCPSFWGTLSCIECIHFWGASLSRLQKTLHAKEPSDPTPGLSCRLAFSDLKIVRKRFWNCTKAF